MSDDIITMLRVLNHHAKKLAENESLHALYRDAFTRCEELTLEAAAEIVRLQQQIVLLRAERDEARRSWCIWVADALGGTPQTIAEKENWDCFKVRSEP